MRFAESNRQKPKLILFDHSNGDLVYEVLSRVVRSSNSSSVAQARNACAAGRNSSSTHPKGGTILIFVKPNKPNLTSVFGRVYGALCIGLVSSIFAGVARGQNVSADFSGYSAKCGVEIRQHGNRLTVAWPIGDGEVGRTSLSLQSSERLIESIGIAANPTTAPKPLLKEVDPVTFLTVGTREAPSARPPDMPVWNVFFDSPAKRPYQTYRSSFELKRVRILSDGRRATVALGDLTIGKFSGELQVTFYSGSRLIHMESVVSTDEDRRAFFYDTGLVGESAGWKHIAWMDTEGQMQRSAVDPQSADRPLAVRHRTIIAESDGGSVACFPPPHQFYFPRDLTDNLKFVWAGKGHGQSDPFGFGVRQSPDGGGALDQGTYAPPPSGD